MQQTHSRMIRAAIGLIAVGGALVTATAQNLEPVPQEQIDQISALLGTQLTAKPAKARTILVFWRCEGFVHGKAIEYGNKAIELAAAKTKAFKVDFANDYEALKPANLAKYDALVLNNTTGLKTQENRFVEPAIVDFVKSGKGIAVIHAGADNFNKAEQAAEMVGGRFWGHPWGSGGTWAFKLDDPANALNQAFGGKGLMFGDEIYQQESPFYNRAKLHVLVSLDFADKATAEAQGQRREDKDYAVSWIRPYGKGRVFYTSFAHDQRAFLNKAVLTHILDGVQYVIGDLKADDTPAGFSDADLNRVKTATDATEKAIFGYLQSVSSHTYNSKTEAANSAKLEALLKDPATTPFGKKAILRVLATSFDAPKDLAPIVGCLKSDETRDWAATLLAGVPGAAADKALTQAMAEADSNLRCTLLSAWAIRKNSAAIAPYAADKDAVVATAALAALGRIGDAAALKALDKPVAASLADARLTALAACIGTLAENGKSKDAARAAKPLLADAAMDPAIRSAAARALLLSDAAFFTTGIKDASPMVRQTVIRSANEVPVSVLAAALKDATPADQAALVAKLAARDAKACTPAVAELLKSDQEVVVCAALRALVTIGGADQVPAILALTTHQGIIGQTATEALNDLRSPDAGKALIALAVKDPALQMKVLNILGERTEAALIPQYEAFLKSDNAELRKETWKALGKHDADMLFKQAIIWLPLVKDSELNQAEAALRVGAKNAEPAARAAAIVAAWKTAGASSKKVLAGLMASYGDPAFIAPLTAALADPDKALRETAIDALADWPSIETFDVLKNAIGSQADADLKTRALRGALKVASAHAGPDTRTRFVELFKLSSDEKTQMTVADGLFKRDGLELFTALQGLFNDPACGAQAKKTYVTFFDQKVKLQTGGPARELDASKWKANASHSGGDAAKAFDRNAGSRWTSGPSEKGMWFSIDLGESVFVTEAVLDTEGSANDTPNGFEVYASNDGKTWAGPVAKGDGNATKKNVIPLASQTQHLKFVLLGGRPGLHWSIHEIHVKAGLDQKKIDEISKVADSVR